MRLRRAAYGSGLAVRRHHTFISHHAGGSIGKELGLHMFTDHDYCGYDKDRNWWCAYRVPTEKVLGRLALVYPTKR